MVANKTLQLMLLLLMVSLILPLMPLVMLSELDDDGNASFVADVVACVTPEQISDSAGNCN